MPTLPTGRPRPHFAGFLGYDPNCDAAHWLINGNLALVRQSVPDARLLVAGAQPEGLEVYGPQPSGVDILGFVSDLERAYASANVVVYPSRIGSGTRVSCLKREPTPPTVSTRLAAKNLAFEDGHDALRGIAMKSVASRNNRAEMRAPFLKTAFR